ncbi:MAG TPA: NUDIX domain-containing protein [Gemmatimonadaceae bacterium]|nr:NUDIX domain-containing protein [Gemmatimonadaceae bacterium]
MARVQEAGAIVFSGDGAARRVLLITAKRDPKNWIFPKGHIEPGESPEAAAVRETREEAGVLGHVLGRGGRVEFEQGEDVIEVQYFLIAADGLTVSEEGRNILWLRLEEALQTLSFEDARSLLRKAWRQLPEHLGATSSPSPS